ncbi:hypothetical protein O181_043411 [Austropuccinia psidii MF-1]|uniref:Uncharacterized protein n=1 Tax=Austropuccinia psidii MF-1 TaxID=1389203 RepID=A0A9Q3HFY7_9BASI|nr:hypothetical protein [Austropuccinia psidii MF-1]
MTPTRSGKADIASIPAVRPESFPTGNNRNIPVSIQELVYGGKATGVGTSSKSLDRHNEIISSSGEVHGPRKDRGSSEGLDTHVLQRTSPTDKSLVENQSIFSEDQKKKLAQEKDKSPVEAAQVSKSKNTPQQVPKEGQEKPKEQSEGKEKGKAQVEQALPTEIQNSKEREDSHGQCVQYGRNSDGIPKQGGGKNQPIISKEIDIIKILNHFETCNKEILANLNNSEYIQQKLGREILQVKE